MPLSPTSYLLCSIGIGVAQIVDAVALRRANGRCGSFAIAFALAEYAWAVVSFLVWRHTHDPFPRWLPVLFIAYVLSFIVAGLFWAVANRGDEKVIPGHMIIAGGMFGAFFAVASLIAIARA